MLSIDSFHTASSSSILAAPSIAAATEGGWHPHPHPQGVATRDHPPLPQTPTRPLHRDRPTARPTACPLSGPHPRLHRARCPASAAPSPSCPLFPFPSAGCGPGPPQGQGAGQGAREHPGTHQLTLPGDTRPHVDAGADHRAQGRPQRH